MRNFKELDEALTEGCDRIMFDNFSPEDTRIAVDIVAGRCETESSGGITYETMIPYAKAGVDFISFGALTHSVKGLDMSFKAAGSDKLVMKITYNRYSRRYRLYSFMIKDGSQKY